jgi:hypothetical protein
MKYFSNTIDNERFNIYSGVDGLVGNILQAQLTKYGRIFHTDPTTPEYMLSRSLSIMFEE